MFFMTAYCVGCFTCPDGKNTFVQGICILEITVTFCMQACLLKRLQPH